jgi:glutathione S-transferase
VLRLYAIPFSTNVERILLAAGHKGIELDVVEVDAGDRGEVEAISGQRLVPVLVEEDGSVLADSPAILRRLEELQPEPRLFPADPARRAELETFVDWFNRVWKRPPNELAAALEEGTLDQAREAELAAELRAALDRFEALLAGRDYLFGEFSAADCTAFPFLKYAVLGLPDGDEEVFHRVLVDYQPLGDTHPRLEAWVRRVDALPRG